MTLGDITNVMTLGDVTNIIHRRSTAETHKTVHKKPKRRKKNISNKKPAVALLSAMRKVPDKVQDNVLKIIHKQISPEAVPMVTATAYYNDLGGQEMAEKIFDIRPYCLRDTEEHGEFACGKVQKRGHVGDCDCGHSCGKWKGNNWAPGDVDHFASFGEQVVEKAKTTPMLQEIVTHDEEHREIWHDPSDRKFRINTVEGGIVPREDCRKNPGNFTLDFIVKSGESCFFNETEKPLPSQDLELVRCVDYGLEMSKILRFSRSSNGEVTGKSSVVKVPSTSLEKKGGRFHLNWFQMVDGKDVLSLTRGYNNVNAIAAAINVKSRYCFLLAIQSGGRKKKNQRAHSVVLEQQRREMKDVGVAMPFRGQVVSGGRIHVFHDARMHANYFFDTPDQIQFEFDAWMMAQRSPMALSPLLDCKARSLTRRSLWLRADIRRVRMRSERESRRIFAKAEAARGTPNWEAVAKATGAKGQRVAETGDPEHGLEPCSDQSVWRRIAHETYHENGIVCNSFRDALYILASPELRQQLSQRQELVIQPTGTKPMPRTVRFKQKKWTSHFCGEKLMQKDHWRRNRMIHDLIPLCDGDSEMVSFVETWHVFVMIETMPSGVSVDMVEGWLAIGSSLMIQFEHLAVTRNPKLLKKCSIT